MDIIGEEHGRLERLLTWLDASRAELVGLVVLFTGALAATGVLWWSAVGPGQAPAPEPDPGAAVSAEHASGAHTPGIGASQRDAPDQHAAGERPEQDEPLTVHVTGAVRSPGVVTLAAGSRVADAIEAAGGASEPGEPHRLNLARVLADGEQVHVPAEGEEVEPPAEGEQGTDAQGLVDLNRADAATLETLPGIGPARAEAIISHREEHGPFAEPGDLRAVAGIGEATFQRLAGDVTVS